MDAALKQQPLVSIMMTTYNRAPLIGEAIRSVLDQNYSNWELLVLDDASTDQTSEVVANFVHEDRRIVYSPAPQNLGIIKNRNRGFALAKGAYIAVLDSDDLWLSKDKIAEQVEFLESHNEHVLVGTNVIVINGESSKIGTLHYYLNDDEIRQKMLMRNQFTHSSVLMRKSALTLPKPYDESGAINIWEDYELFLRLGLIGQLANLPREMTGYRQHNGNISKTQKRKGALTHLEIIKRYKNNYPDYWLAYLKGILRMLLRA